MKKYFSISQVAKDFVNTAKVTAKTIIREYNKPVKTIPPNTIGGQAGGCKYIWEDIIFKFAVDWLGIYHSDEYAQKAASHELKTAMRFYQLCPGLRIPLLAVIDYRGYRMVAESILPLTAETIRYGSNDGGHNLHDSDPELSKMMKRCARKINIAGHKIKGKTMYGPFDIEGHKGTDGHYYLLDFARVFPPTVESGQDVHQTYLYRLLRPEFVKNYHVPLSSDAFSLLSVGETFAEENQRVRDASAHLFNSVIPHVADMLVQEADRHLESLENQLTESVHREGVNIRYLGLLRKHIVKRSERLGAILLLEMCARSIKNILKSKLREKSKQPGITENRIHLSVMTYLNFLLGRSSPSESMTPEAFWHDGIKAAVTKQFRASLTPTEMRAAFDLRLSLNMHKLVNRICQLVGIKVSKQAMSELSKADPFTFAFVLPDIKKISAKVKHMNITSLSEAMEMALRSSRTGGPASERLFNLAQEKFEQSIRSIPDNEKTLIKYGEELMTHGDHIKEEGDSAALVLVYYQKAFDKLRQARHVEYLLMLGQKLVRRYTDGWEERDQFLALAERCYEELSSFSTGPANPPLKRSLEDSRDDTSYECNEVVCRGFFEWARVLLYKARRCCSLTTYKAAGERFQRALEADIQSFPTLDAAVLRMCDNPVRMAIIFELFLKNTSFYHFDITSLFDAKLVDEDLLTCLPAFSRCSSLAYLDLTGCCHLDLSKALPISHLKNLETLIISDSSVDDNLLKLIVPEASELTTLLARSCRITDQGLEALGRLTKLATLDLSGCLNITDGGILKMIQQGCQSLRKVLFSCTEGITDTGIGFLAANLSQLQHLSVSRCPNITEAGINKLLAEQPALRLHTLDISKSRLSARSLCDFLTSPICSALRELDLSWIAELNDNALTQFIKLHGMKCERLVLFGCENITNASIEVMATHCQLLVHLDISKCITLSSSALPLLIKSNPRLQHFHADNCHRLDDSVLVALGESGAATSVVLNHMKHITDEGINSLVSGCKNLERLEFSLCKKLTDKSLFSIANNCPRLRILVLQCCPDMTDRGTTYLVQNCHYIEVLDFSGSRCIGDLCVLEACCPFLTWLSLHTAAGVSESSFEAIFRMPSLRYLNVYDLSRIVDNHLFILKQNAHSLQELVYGGNKFSQDGLAQFKNARPHVQVHTHQKPPNHTADWRHAQSFSIFHVSGRASSNRESF